MEIIGNNSQISQIWCIGQPAREKTAKIHDVCGYSNRHPLFLIMSNVNNQPFNVLAFDVWDL